VLEQLGVLGGEPAGPLRHHAVDRTCEVTLEQTLAHARDVGVGVQDLLEPGGAGAWGAAAEEEKGHGRKPKKKGRSSFLKKRTKKLSFAGSDLSGKVGSSE
jgi:hypothetical protein